MAQDIVCGMEIEEDDSRTVVKTFLDKTFFFCCAECMLIFIKDPAYFLSGTMKDEATAVDLVCGMSVDKSIPPYFTEYKGMLFYFCSHACKEQFEGNPRQFVGS